MAQTRWHLSKKGKMIEFPFNDEGLQQAKNERKRNPLFKYGRIIQVLQFYPSQIDFGKIYTIKGWETREEGLKKWAITAR